MVLFITLSSLTNFAHHTPSQWRDERGLRLAGFQSYAEVDARHGLGGAISNAKRSAGILLPG
jgi:hypothetical protein